MAPLATEDAGGDGGDGVEDLEKADDGHCGGGDGDDVGVVSEALGDEEAGGEEEAAVEGTEDGGEGEGCVGGGGGRGGGHAADVGADSGGCGDREGKWDLVHYGASLGDDGLRGDVGGGKVGRHKGEDFEGEVFSFDHDEAWEGELDHGPPVCESAFAKAAPTLTSCYEADIEEEKQWHEVVHNDNSDWGTSKANSNGRVPHEGIVQEGVQWSTDQKNDRRGHKQTLCLGITLSAFKEGVSGAKTVSSCPR